ncbi:MAG TPA: hypothetical protein HPP81_04970 [Deltaproteobacteria bacterium]|jgi:hypothetical protein|nr:hypothetical protein [Deltaproteobacteria bacterium]
MKNRSRYLATSLIVFLSIGILAVAGYLRAAENDQGTMEGQKAIMEGAKKMMDGNKMIMDTVAKKGMKDAEFTAAEKMMTDAYNMVTKGESMMTGNTMPEGKAMVTRGAKMMLEAQKTMAAAVEKKGLTTVCSLGLDTCMTAEKKITFGLEGS